MGAEVFGFIGCYNHDIILLLSKALSSMNKKVLLVDRNYTQTISTSIPVPENLSVKSSVVSFDFLNFTKTELSMELLEKYDFVLVDFGIHSLHYDKKLCNRFFFVSDMLPHHMRSLLNLDLYKDAVQEILIRDALWPNKRKEKEMNEFFKEYRNHRIVFLKPDRQDIRNRYVCEAEFEYQVKNASESLQEVICEIVLSICKEITRKDYFKRLHHTERRHYL